jgi:hypothetical protein
MQTAARRAAAGRRVANPLYLPTAQTADPVLFSGGTGMHLLEPEHAARLRLMLSDLCVLLALLLTFCLETLVHRLQLHNVSTILLLFVSFCASAVFVTAARSRIISSLRWADEALIGPPGLRLFFRLRPDSRIGAAVLTMGTLVLAIFFLTRQGMW